ncbi:hypothetical protein ACS0TY_005567 [Phlomoides rotata]
MLFADKYGTRISSSWLEYLEDMDALDEYAWGTTTLAFLYRQLGQASRFKVKQISDYLTLLETWIYEHFPTLVRPPHNANFVVGNPLSGRWALEGHVGPSSKSLLSFRERLDALSPHEVNWNPYAKLRAHYKLHDVTLFHGCIYGYVQTVPERPLIARVGRGNWAAFPSECSEDYLTWYCANTHIYVNNPDLVHRSNLEPVIDDDPWLMINLANNIMVPVVKRWKGGDTPSIREAMQVMVLACRALQVTDHVGASGSKGQGKVKGIGKGKGKKTT